MDWQDYIIDTPAGIEALLSTARRIAVLGMESDEHQDKPAYFVPAYLIKAGLEVFPIPLKYPDLQTVAGLKAYRKLTDIPGQIDIVDVFLRPDRIDDQLDDIQEKHPGAVWLQQGIRDDRMAETLAADGIKVVQDMCLMRAYMAYHDRHNP